MTHKEALERKIKEQQARIEELEREVEALRRHYDAAAPEHNLLALLDLYYDRIETSEWKAEQLQRTVEDQQAEMDRVKRGDE